MASHDASNSESAFPSILRWGGLIVILAVAALRCLSNFSPILVFDADPVLDATALGGFGPGGSLILDAVVFAACGLAMYGESRSGRSLHLIWILLALIPLPLVILHGLVEFGHLWRGMTWAAAAPAAVTIAHLAREPSIRRFALAGLLAVLLPLIVRGGWQVVIEHPQTVQHFEQHRDEFFASRGWEPDSPQSQMYERRLRQPQPHGWFITTNIFASLMAAGAVIWLGIVAVIGTKPTFMTRGLAWWTLLPAGLLLIACAWLLWLTGSKGAMLAALIGAVILLLSVIDARFGNGIHRRIGAWCGGVVAVALVFFVLLTVAVRGLVLPEDFLGDRSLLFRWHYMESSVSILAEDPWRGVGPAGFQDAYLRHRLPRNPEEVTSAHSMFIDWICMLGATGAAWVLLTLLFVRRAGMNVWALGKQPSPEGEGSTSTAGDCRASAGMTRTDLVLLSLIALGGPVAAVVAEAHVVDDGAYIARSVGVLLFLVGGVFVLSLARLAHAALLAATSAAAVVLVLHGQIEMTFTQPGAALWVMALLGVAASSQEAGEGSADEKESPASRETASQVRSAHRAVGIVVALGAVIFAMWIVAWWAAPAVRQTALMIDAARTLHAAVQPGMPPAEKAEARLQAAEQLGAASDLVPGYSIVRQRQVEQLLLASLRLRGEARESALRRAVAEAHRGMDKFATASWLMWLSTSAHQLARVTGDEEDWRTAINTARHLTVRDPHGVEVWVRYADLLWERNRLHEARVAYSRAMSNSRQFELDSLKQLPDAERRRIERRIEQTPDS